MIIEKDQRRRCARPTQGQHNRPRDRRASRRARDRSPRRGYVLVRLFNTGRRLGRTWYRRAARALCMLCVGEVTPQRCFIQVLIIARRYARRGRVVNAEAYAARMLIPSQCAQRAHQKGGASRRR